eukprot:gene2881-biopygen6173
MLSNIVIGSCRRTMASEDVIGECHWRMAPEDVTGGCHLRMSSGDGPFVDPSGGAERLRPLRGLLYRIAKRSLRLLDRDAQRNYFV